MLNITEAAGEYLTAVLERAKVPDDTAIRIRLQDDALAPVIDTAHADDETFDHNGRMILLLDTRAHEYLADSLLEIEETPDGPKLLILQWRQRSNTIGVFSSVGDAQTPRSVPSICDVRQLPRSRPHATWPVLELRCQTY